MKLQHLAATALLALGVPAGAGVYYVDPSGNDSHDGLAASRAWKTLDKVNAFAFQPGDILKFKRGGLWNGQLRPLGSGLPGQPIKITGYGSTGDGRPMVNARDFVPAGNQFDAALYLKNQHHWTVEELEFLNDKPGTTGNRYGIYIHALNCGTMASIHLKNLVVRDVSGTSTGGGAGIMFYAGGSAPYTRFDDIWVDRCHVANVNGTGIRTAQQHQERPQLLTHFHENVRFSNNVVENAGRDGIVAIGCLNAVIEHNVVAGANQLSNDYAVGIWAFSSDNTKIQYNEVYSTRGPLDGQGFDADYNCDGTKIQYNYSHDNEGGFVLVTSNGAAPESMKLLKNTIVRYNISQNDHDVLIKVSGPAETTKIFNNTLYVGAGTPLAAVFRAKARGGEIPSMVRLWNNIFSIDPSAFAWTDIEAGISNILFDCNVFFSPNQSNMPADPNLLTSDPKLSNPGNGSSGAGCYGPGVFGYKIKSGSPARDSGMSISGAGGQDYFGNPVPNTVYSGSTDRGAHEY